MPFDRNQGDEQLLAYFTIRESLRNQSEHFQLALAQWFNQRLAGRQVRVVFALRRLGFDNSQQLANVVSLRPMCIEFGQELGNWRAFVDKHANEALRLCSAERVIHQLYRSVVLAICVESNCLQNHYSK